MDLEELPLVLEVHIVQVQGGIGRVTNGGKKLRKTVFQLEGLHPEVQSVPAARPARLAAV